MAGRLQGLLFFLILGAGYAAATAEALAADLRIVQDRGSVSVLEGDRLVLHYRYGDVPMKPYADQLCSPDGVQVLRDSPHDHKHHHGLMYAVGVDRVDFWIEAGQGFANQGIGKQRHRSLGEVKSAVRDGTGRAGFVEELDWVGADADKLLMLECREIDLLRADDLGATLLDWRCRLQTPPGKDSLVITGSHYFGLGMRFLKSMDAGGRFFNADDKSGTVVRGTERVTPVRWSAYAAKADGRPVTAAMFDDPANLRHPATMFTMSEPFAYLSATLNEWKEPLTVKADKPLTLRYGVALWDGEADKATVEKLYQRWLKLSPP